MGCEDGNTKNTGGSFFLFSSSSSSSCRYTCPLAGWLQAHLHFRLLLWVGGGGEKQQRCCALLRLCSLSCSLFHNNKQRPGGVAAASILPRDSVGKHNKNHAAPRSLTLLHRHPEAHAHIVIIGERASPSSFFFSRPSFSWGETEEKPRGLAVLSSSFSFFFFLLRGVQETRQTAGGFLDQINHTRPAVPLHNNKLEDKEGGNHTRAHQERDPSVLFSSYS